MMTTREEREILLDLREKYSKELKKKYGKK